ncbi:hypothetical protein KM043_008601 [Ampulex compressa]|nr:hypothetical protein KM043_008601 [Ampulex compressa]
MLNPWTLREARGDICQGYLAAWLGFYAPQFQHDLFDRDRGQVAPRNSSVVLFNGRSSVQKRNERERKETRLNVIEPGGHLRWIRLWNYFPTDSRIVKNPTTQSRTTEMR